MIKKNMFPETGVTSGELLAYYETMAPDLLPYLRERALILERLPNGVGGRLLKHKSDLPVNDERTLLHLVEHGTITFYPRLSRLHRAEFPDFVIFDLNVGRARFDDCVHVAHELRAILAEREVESEAMTSGKTGLHVLVPNTMACRFAEARAWARHVARDVVIELPKLATIERNGSGQGRRVYIDVSRNAKDGFFVPPFVVRVTPDARVSWPLDWDELKPGLDPTAFNVSTVLDLIERQASRGQKRA